MILDKIDNASRYINLHPAFAKVFEFIKSNTFKEMAEGRYEIDGDALFVILKKGPTNPISDQRLESHRKYIDVQYVIEGIEEMGVAVNSGQQPTQNYDDQEDYMLFQEPYNIVTVSAGMFAIFFPDDMHLPDLTLSKPEIVKKAVFKIRIL